jgi:hypothetical protein
VTPCSGGKDVRYLHGECCPHIRVEMMKKCTRKLIQEIFSWTKKPTTAHGSRGNTKSKISEIIGIHKVIDPQPLLLMSVFVIK